MSPLPLLVAALAGLAPPLPPLPQEGTGPDEVAADPRDSEAAALWRTFVDAAYGDEVPAERVRSLRFRVEALTRQDASSNELEAEIAFLEPYYLHMQLTSGREVARGPRPGGGWRDWFRERGGEALDLVGRDYATDREQLDQLVSLCVNFLTLTQPQELARGGLETVRAPRGPADGRHAAKKLDWISFTSSDLNLPGEPATPPGGVPSLHRVDLGLEPGAGLLHRARITPLRTGDGRELSPLYLSFARHQRQSGLVLPGEIRVYHQVEGGGYEDRATFEVYLLEAELGPDLQPADFAPDAPR